MAERDSPPPSSTAARAVMLGNRARDTTPERALRSELHRRGLRFRADYPVPVRGVRTRADVVFTRQRLAVYVDGCFWHRCPIHGTEPRANSSYWKPKLDANAARDARVTEALRAGGWEVLRVWAHVPPDEAATAVVAALHARAGITGSSASPAAPPQRDPRSRSGRGLRSA